MDWKKDPDNKTRHCNGNWTCESNSFTSFNRCASMPLCRVKIGNTVLLMFAMISHDGGGMHPDYLVLISSNPRMFGRIKPIVIIRGDLYGHY